MLDCNQDNNVSSPFVSWNLVVQTQQTPGVVLFNNYEQVKSIIQSGVAYYSGVEYTLENYTTALKHRDELKNVKTILENTKKEIIKGYNAPLETVLEKIDELIDFIKTPFKKVDSFIKQNNKNVKKYEIYVYAKNLAFSSGLNAHAAHVLNSPAFFDEKWYNASCSKANWRSSVLGKITQAMEDIRYILSMDTDKKAIILAHYYQTLSLDRVLEFINTLEQTASISDNFEAFNIPQASFEVECTAKEKQAHVSQNIEYGDGLKDFEVLGCIANGNNPYTGGMITGVDEYLKIRLHNIMDKMVATDTQNVDKALECVEEKITVSAVEVLKTIVNACAEISKINYFGVTKLIQVLRGSKSFKLLQYKLNNLSCYGKLKFINNNYLFDIIEFLIDENFLYKTQGEYPIVKINKNKALDTIQNIDFSIVEEILALNEAKEIAKLPDVENVKTMLVDGLEVFVDDDGELLTDLELFKRLRVLRNRLAEERALAYYYVARNSLLVQLATLKPTTKEEFLSVKGIGERWFENNGEIFMKEIKNYLQGD